MTQKSRYRHYVYIMWSHDCDICIYCEYDWLIYDHVNQANDTVLLSHNNIISWWLVLLLEDKHFTVQVSVCLFVYNTD